MQFKTLIPVIAAGLAVAGIAGTLHAQVLPGQAPDPEITVRVEPFDSDGVNHAPEIAARTGWMLHRKLRAGDFKLPEYRSDDAENGGTTAGESDGAGTGVPEADWRVTGKVSRVLRDPDGTWQGPRLFGVARIPLKAEVTVNLQRVDDPDDSTELRYTIRYAHPRLRVFGINRSPYPETTRAIDAMIHDTVMTISRDLIRLIREHEH
ncbi:MAG TPA: hypothetical protein PLV45_00345, partial [bacterium]|nr:hypothetical protein [bacterium]